jgi:hypothetical protein
MRNMKWFLCVLLTSSTAMAGSPASMDALARDYMLLTLAMGAHDSNYVDAYYGPADLQAEATKTPQSLAQIKSKAKAMQAAIGKLSEPDAGSMDALRLEFLKKQTVSMLGRIDLLQGKKLSFDAESAVLYDTVAPRHDRAHFDAVIKQIDALLPGAGTTAERVNDFRSKFVIPREKLKPVFDAAIQGCREQTLKHITLPEGENFELEFVTDKPWSGYNWYKGKYQSLIQVNIEQPIYIERAIDLGCHEGYPGHHVYNVLLEKNLVNDRKWPEYSVYPLYSPQSLIAEGTANYGVELAFPEPRRKAFQRDVLYPLAGIDPALMEKYDALLKLTSQLSYADTEAGRDYLDGKMNRPEAIDWLVNVQLQPSEKASQSTKFFDTYRSYIINYTVGKDLVKDYIEASSRAATSEPEREEIRWRAFEQLLSTPRVPSNLRPPSAARR